MEKFNLRSLVATAKFPSDLRRYPIEGESNENQ